MKVTFWGAARKVTGSMYLLELEDGYKILIDCGTDFSSRSQDPLFPFRPSELDLVVLTHAHLDHSGNIPNLFLEGYEGQVLCTPPTLSLTEVILRDAASIHTKALKHLLGKSKSRGIRTAVGNRYMEKQVNEAMDRFITIAFQRKFEIRRGLFVTFIPAGHLLGAASILFETEEEGILKRIVFSGDVGRGNYP